MERDTSGQRSIGLNKAECSAKLEKNTEVVLIALVGYTGYLLGYSWNTYSVYAWLPSKSLPRSLCYPTYPADSQSVLTPILLACNPSRPESLHP